MSKAAEQIEAARRAYVAALGTSQEASMRKRLEWAIQEARVK